MRNNAPKPLASVAGINNSHYTQLVTYFDRKYQTAWCYMQPSSQPCFTPALLTELNFWCNELEANTAETRGIRYHVLASNVPDVYNLGGDLGLFRSLIQNRNKAALHTYAKTCIDALYANIIHFKRDITTISLVQGDALGGGFETAMSSDVLIAERSSKMGLPEILFNLFPGMGAYSLLSRRLGGARAERMILSGRIYGAEELFEMGVVDVLAEDLQGEMAVYDYIRREDRAANGYRAVRAAKHRVDPITYEELMGVAELWVDAAMRLEPRDLHMMGRLAARQPASQERRNRGGFLNRPGGSAVIA